MRTKKEIEKLIWKKYCQKLVVDEVVRTLSRFQENLIIWREK